MAEAERKPSRSRAEAERIRGGVGLPTPPIRNISGHSLKNVTVNGEYMGQL